MTFDGWLLSAGVVVVLCRASLLWLLGEEGREA